MNMEDKDLAFIESLLVLMEKHNVASLQYADIKLEKKQNLKIAFPAPEKKPEPVTDIPEPFDDPDFYARVK